MFTQSYCKARQIVVTVLKESPSHYLHLNTIHVLYRSSNISHPSEKIMLIQHSL